jgi:hypothetical protein
MVDSTEEEFKGVCPLLLIFISSLSGLRIWIDERFGGRLAIYDADDRDWMGHIGYPHGLPGYVSLFTFPYPFFASLLPSFLFVVFSETHLINVREES